MVQLASILEPVTVVSLLLLGSLVNRWTITDSFNDTRQRFDDLPEEPLNDEADYHPIRPKRVSSFDSFISKTWVSRTLRRFPFLVEVWYWALIYWVNPSFLLCAPLT
jgi:hypothetical protein